MRRSIRIYSLSLGAMLGLSACAMGPRSGPPAPVVQVTPRSTQPAPPSQTSAQSPAPKVPAQPAPPQRPVQVYAYRDPSLALEPAKPAPPAVAPDQTSLTPGDQGGAPAPGDSVPKPSQPDASSGPAAPPAPGTPPAAPQPAPAEVQPPAPKPPVAAIGPSPVMPPSEQPGRAGRPATRLPPSDIAVPDLPPAAAKLAVEAEQHRRAGDYPAAAAALERSLRIAPRDPYLLNRLARVRLEQGQAALAANLATRANDLAGDREDLKRDNWRIIAESRRQIGDEKGAREAEQRAGPLGL